MAVFALILNEPSEAAWSKLKNVYKEPCYYRILTDRIAFLSCDDITVTQDIANSLGMDESDGCIGASFLSWGTISGRNGSAIS